MRCLVINLDRSSDRLAHVTAEFSRAGVPFERIQAVDSAMACTVEFAPLTAAEIACFLSHRKCWQIVAGGSEPYAAIFEDDIVFGEKASGLLLNEDWIPGDADVIKLETFLSPVKIARNHTPVRGGYSLARLIGTHVGSAGYIVSKNAAARLLSGTTRLKGAVDIALFSPVLMTCARNTNYQLVPALCIQSQLLPDGNALPSAVQLGRRPHIRRRFVERALREASRGFAHLRNWTFFGAEKVPFVAFRR